MMTIGPGSAVLPLLGAYLFLLFWGSAVAARQARRPVWLFGQAKGGDRLAAFGFRAAFVLALLGPSIWLFMPAMGDLDPLWSSQKPVWIGVAGRFIASLGAMLAFAAQMSMAASWRIGVAKGANGVLVTAGLFGFSRNPTFVGQFFLLVGTALALPSIPTSLAALLFAGSAVMQVRSEERELQRTLGTAYDSYCRAVPRWIGIRKGSLQ